MDEYSHMHTSRTTDFHSHMRCLLVLIAATSVWSQHGVSRAKVDTQTSLTPGGRFAKIENPAEHVTTDYRKPKSVAIADQVEMRDIVGYEPDRHGIMIKVSIVIFLGILILLAGTMVSSFFCDCVEGMRRRRRIRDWEASSKGMSSPKKYTQSYGEPETDVETVAS